MNILAILGGIPAAITAIETALKFAFTVYNTLKMIGDPEKIPSFEEIAQRAKDGAAQVDADMAEIQEWLDSHPA